MYKLSGIDKILYLSEITIYRKTGFCYFPKNKISYSHEGSDFTYNSVIQTIKFLFLNFC